MTGGSGSRRLLIIGTSHVHVLRAASAERAQGGPRAGRARTADGVEIEVISTREPGPAMDDGELTLDRCDWSPAPDAVCVVMAANLYNQIGLFAGPRPYRIGAREGAVPASGSEASPFVPRGLMTAHLRKLMERFDRWSEAVHRHFPGAAFMHMSSPPPAEVRYEEVLAALRDGEAVERAYGIWAPDGEDRLPPPPLRLALWEIQTGIEAERAARLGAPFLTPPGEVRGAGGLLGRGYWDGDPTHGNLAYGRLMLDRILGAARAGPA